MKRYSDVCFSDPHCFSECFLQDMEFAKAAFEEAAESGHPEAQMGIGFLYATGNYFLLFTSRLDLKYGTFKTLYIKF